MPGGRLLNIVKLEGTKYMTIKCDGVEISGYDDIVYDAKTNKIGNHLIYTNIDSATGNTEFKTLNEGVYLVFLDNDLCNLNSKFATSIEYKDGRNNVINIKPLDSSLISTAKNLDAIVVNKDGQYAYTDNEGFLRVNINYSISSQSDKTTSEAQEAIIAQAINNICDGFEQKVASLYGIKDAELILNVDKSDYTNIVIISGTLSGEGDINEAAIYVSRELMCEIKVVDKD